MFLQGWDKEVVTFLALVSEISRLIEEGEAKQKPNSKRHNEAKRLSVQVERVLKCYPGYLPDGYADKAEPLIDKASQFVQQCLEKE